MRSVEPAKAADHLMQPGNGGETVSSVLSLEGVAKRYTAKRGAEVVALAPCTLSIGEGEFVSVVGPSGCGKTTLLKLCAGLLQPSMGIISHRGTGAPPPSGSYGMVFQSPALLPWRTVRKNIVLPQQLLSLDRRKAQAQTDALLKLVRLPDAANKYPHELSGGMQQRVAIARALLHDPEVLLMDEPFGALDAMTRDELNLSLQEIHGKAGKTVLFITHDVAEAVFLADRVVVMSAGPGRIIGEVTVKMPRPRTIDNRIDEPFRRAEVEVRRLLATARHHDDKEETDG